MNVRRWNAIRVWEADMKSHDSRFSILESTLRILYIAHSSLIVKKSKKHFPLLREKSQAMQKNLKVQERWIMKPKHAWNFIMISILGISKNKTMKFCTYSVNSNIKIAIF